MVQLLISVACYFLTAILHIVLHRVLAYGFGKLTKQSFLIFIPGVLVTGWIVFSIVPSDIPTSAMLLYLLLTATHFLFFMSFFFDARSPSAKLLFLIRRHGPMTRENILTHFSDTETVINRVDTLIYEGYLVEMGNRLYAADKAIPVARFMRWERGG